MNRNELRTGNLVFIGKEVHQLQTVGQWLHTDQTVDEVPISALQPIPLTEDWLRLGGFEKRGESFFKGKLLIEPGISQFFNNGMSFRITTDAENSTHVCNVKYLHDLQNAYHLVYREELELATIYKFTPDNLEVV